MCLTSSARTLLKNATRFARLILFHTSWSSVVSIFCSSTRCLQRNLSEKSLTFITSKLSTQIGNYLANNNDFLERVSKRLPPSDGMNAATSTSGGYDASAGTAGSNEDDAPRFDGQQTSRAQQLVIQVIETEKSKKVTSYYGCERVVCPTCNKMVTLKNLPSHLDTHLMYDKRPYHCELCKAYFAYKRNYDQHMRTQHPQCRNL